MEMRFLEKREVAPICICLGRNKSNLSRVKKNYFPGRIEGFLDYDPNSDSIQ